MEIAAGIRRLGEGLVNVYLLEEAGEITIVDAGAPGYWKDLLAELATMGRSLDDVRALVLTHAHSDHVGFAERIRRERGVPVQVHPDDATLARGEVKPVRDRRRSRVPRPQHPRPRRLRSSSPSPGHAAGHADREVRRSSTGPPSTSPVPRGRPRPRPHGRQRRPPRRGSRRGLRRRRVRHPQRDHRAPRTPLPSRQFNADTARRSPRWRGSTALMRGSSCPATATRGPAAWPRVLGEAAPHAATSVPP